MGNWEVAGSFFIAVGATLQTLRWAIGWQPAFEAAVKAHPSRASKKSFARSERRKSNIDAAAWGLVATGSWFLFVVALV